MQYTANSLENHWMPFTSNREFKESPRLVVKGEGVHIWDHKGGKLLDGSSGLFCCAAGHGRTEIAEAVSQDTGWMISRSSHKLRNPKNAPDAYTAAAIEEFLARQNAGEAAADLAKAEIVEAEGGQVFRMVKAIPTGELCLNCHGGTEVKPEVVEALAELYPEDQARGFKVGEMRGVFTLQKPLN